ncbi:PhzF family phenazine biosynthesis protein [Planctomonas sp. JC2975]|uniref:PhzF family phenazine biosynthesis protein n=1 Tax=Planctomonas sp. JC2975 TaxID=2729626 RepID=UPI001475E3B5|nr:PhzF family phenazine biosynthesis protein [Planctomonas sp. JC2975]NNC11056.1 PhzF family phenazine biosynthesis protein [Planctomonas sp. JC2975]
MTGEGRRFVQVDVFGSQALAGNPVAVVVDADGLTDIEMERFARWTNLSETTFLLPPTDPAADYRLRIFTPGGELPFAGHPTLGSAHAWLRSGGVRRSTDAVVQQCGVGLVELRTDGDRLAFAAPPLLHSGAADEETTARAADSLRIRRDEVLAAEWVDNGPGWLAVLLGSAEEVLALRPDFGSMKGLKVGVVAPQTHDHDADFEVRAFVPDLGIPEDPVTGSLNAGLAMWLIGSGRAADHYVAAQGTAIGRSGRVHVDRNGDRYWIGGETRTVIEGSVAF